MKKRRKILEVLGFLSKEGEEGGTRTRITLFFHEKKSLPRSLKQLKR